jgi:hypothetical protein
MPIRENQATVRRTLAVASLLLLLLTGCTDASTGETPAPADQSGETAAAAAGDAGIEIPHLHGLGYSADGRQLFVPAHDGLRVYADGKWSVPDVMAHDYMGYTPSSDGFYSSGHPDPSSGLVNPFGLVKSTDGGKTLVNLGFSGETDFHFMAVGYQNHAIYVGNPAANSQLQPGIYYSLDDDKTWQPSALQGLTAQPIQMAVHPLEANVVAMATEDGLFLSTDYGNSFARIGEGGTVSAVAFAPDGKTLLYGYQQLSSYDLSAQQSIALSPPTMAAEDAIGYIAVNPVRPDEIALATFGKDIYLAQDDGQTWTQIVDDGKAR